MKDYYKILQIHPEASLEVMNNAYRALVKQYHPDLYHTRRKDWTDGKMQEINEAYQVLSNAGTRAEYDRRYRSQASKPPQVSSQKPGLGNTLKRMLLWGIGTYIALRLLLLPALTNPVLRIILLCGLAYLMIRLYQKRKLQP